MDVKLIRINYKLEEYGTFVFRNNNYKFLYFFNITKHTYTFILFFYNHLFILINFECKETGLDRLLKI